MHRSFLLASSLCLLACGLVGQSSLTLQGEGGSYPGRIALTVSKASLGRGGAVLMSLSPGPIPVSLFNPGDKRKFDVGYTGLFALPGVFMPPGVLTIPPIKVPSNPSFMDATIYMQGLALASNPIIGAISQPQPIRMAPAGTIRDRRKQFTLLRCQAMPIERADQRVMLTGGGSGALWAQVARKTTEIYNQLTDNFSAGPDMTVERSIHTATRLPNGDYLLTGGVDGNNNPQATAEIYNAKTDLFVKTAPLAATLMFHTATLMPDGRVFVMGGNTINSLQNIVQMITSARTDTEFYDPKTGKWSPGPHMKNPRSGHKVIALKDGRLLVVGGVGGKKILSAVVPVIWDTAEVYEPKTNQFKLVGNLAVAHALPGLTLLDDGRVLAVGGGCLIQLPNNLGVITNVAELFDPKTNTWSSAGKMKTPRMLFEAYNIGNGRILHIGGADGNFTNPVAVATTEIYNVKTNTWSAGPKLAGPRAAFSSYVNKTGQIHILGGVAGVAATCLNTTEWYYR